MVNQSVYFPSYTKSEELHYHKQDDALYPILLITIDDELRKYYFKRKCYKPCSCETFKIKFGYNPNNNSLSAYCIHCDYRHPKGLSQVKNSCKRDNNEEYKYFTEYQKEKDRFFCEICLKDTLLKIHHTIEVCNGGSHDPENLQLLCSNCHNIVHAIRSIKNG